MGYSSPTESSFVQLAFEGCQRLSKKDPVKKESRTSDMIKNLVHRHERDNATIFDMRFVLICLLGFFKIFRIEELLQIKIKHVQIKESHLEVLVPKSKTDKHRKGHKVYIFGIESDCC